MKKFQTLCAVIMLLFALTSSAVGGHIGTDKTPPPASATTSGHIGTDAVAYPAQQSIESERLLTEITLSLLQLLAVI